LHDRSVLLVQFITCHDITPFLDTGLDAIYHHLEAI